MYHYQLLIKLSIFWGKKELQTGLHLVTHIAFYKKKEIVVVVVATAIRYIVRYLL